MENFFPEILITYLLPFRQAFSQPGWKFFQGFMASLLLAKGRKCVTRIADTCVFIDKSLSSWERFLAEARWDLQKVTHQLISLIVQELGHSLLYAGRYLVGIDTTFAQKVSRRMLGVQRWTEANENRSFGVSVFGHHWGICGLLHRIEQRWQCLPIITRFISGKNQPSHFAVNATGEASPQGFWDAVLAMVFQVAACITTAPLTIVADAYFAKAPFINPLVACGIHLVSRLRWDAVGFDDPIYCGQGRHPKKGKKWKLATLLNVCPRQTVRAAIYGRVEALEVVVRDVWLREVKKKVRVVVIDAKTRPILLISTALSLTAKEIIEIYAARFALELAIRDLKQHLGFCDYQSTTTIAFHRFSQLCCCALSIGRLILSTPQSLSWVPPSSRGNIFESTLSFAKLKRGLRQFVLCRLLFSKFARQADVEKRKQELDAILRIAA